MATKKLVRIVQDMKRHHVLEDRREYDAEMLMDAYVLTKAESEELYSLVQAEFSDQKLKS